MVETARRVSTHDENIRRELFRFFQLGAGWVAQGKDLGRLVMFSGAIDAFWHRHLADPGFIQDVRESCGVTFGHHPLQGSGQVSWVREYEALFGQLDRSWFTSAEGRFDAPAYGRYLETGKIEAAWNCTPIIDH